MYSKFSQSNAKINKNCINSLVDNMEPVPSTSFDTSQRDDHDEPLENILSLMFSPGHNMPSPDYEMQTQEVLNDEDLYGIL